MYGLEWSVFEINRQTIFNLVRNNALYSNTFTQNVLFNQFIKSNGTGNLSSEFIESAKPRNFRHEKLDIYQKEIKRRYGRKQTNNTRTK